MSFSSLALGGLLLSWTGYSCRPIFAVPAGKIRFWLPIAVETSAGDTPSAYMRSGSRSTMTWRCLPPYGYGLCNPGIVINCGRRVLIARSNICCSGNESLEIESWMIGTSDALYWMISGGWVPGGIERIEVWETAVTCAVAFSIFAF